MDYETKIKTLSGWIKLNCATFEERAREMRKIRLASDIELDFMLNAITGK